MPLSPAAAASDPLFDLIERYRERMAYFNANAKGCTSQQSDDLADATFMPLWDELSNSPPAPTTYAGAIAGLDFLAEQFKDHTYSDALNAVLGRSLAFLREAKP